MSSDTKASAHDSEPAFSRRLFIPTIALSLVLCTTRGVVADGWKVQLQGVKELGLSYAGRSIYVDDASTVWFNPAGMSRLPKTWTITIAAPVISYGLRFTDRGSTTLLGQPLTGGAPAEGGQAAVVPHGYVVWRLSDRWSVGGGFNAPYGLGNDYGEAWTGRYFATKSLLRVFNINPVMAVKLGHQLSLGAGLTYNGPTPSWPT